MSKVTVDTKLEKQNHQVGDTTGKGKSVNLESIFPDLNEAPDLRPLWAAKTSLFIVISLQQCQALPWYPQMPIQMASVHSLQLPVIYLVRRDEDMAYNIKKRVENLSELWRLKCYF